MQDIFIEKLNPDNRGQYLTPEGWRPFETAQMSIVVKGGGVRNVERRRTRHGPVLPGFYRNLDGMLGDGYVAALQWTALSSSKIGEVFAWWATCYAKGLQTAIDLDRDGDATGQWEFNQFRTFFSKGEPPDLQIPPCPITRTVLERARYNFGPIGFRKGL